jgi:hypothetical protein
MCKGKAVTTKQSQTAGGAMTDTDTLRLLRQVEVAHQADNMSRAERQQYLRANRWRRINGNIWTDPDGRPFSFGAAVRLQLSRDLEAP